MPLDVYCVALKTKYSSSTPDAVKRTQLVEKAICSARIPHCRPHSPLTILACYCSLTPVVAYVCLLGPRAVGALQYIRAAFVRVFEASRLGGETGAVIVALELRGARVLNPCTSSREGEREGVTIVCSACLIRMLEVSM